MHRRSNPGSSVVRAEPLTRALCLAAALACVPAAVPVNAQTPFGHIHGSVVDETGDSLPGVSVTLSGVGAQQIAITGDSGEYRFLNLDPGRYQLVAHLDGYSTVDQPNVVVTLNRSSTIRFTLNSAMEDTITVTSEGPLLDERMIKPGTVFNATELQSIPTPRTPWDILTQAPGVTVRKVNVGGAETGDQEVFLGLATSTLDNDYLMDGIQITSMSFLQFSSSHLDFEQFETIDVATGGVDVTKNTPGVALNMVTRRGTNEFRGSARFLSVKDDGLGFLGGSSSNFDCSDLHPDQDCDTFTSNRIKAISEYGFHAGGPVVPERLWLWGSYGVNDYTHIVAGGGEEAGVTENTSVKLNAQLSKANTAVASWNNGVKEQRGAATIDRAPETAQNTIAGPAAFWRLEDSHVFSSNLYLNASLQKTDSGFSATPRSGCIDFDCPLNQETLLDTDGVWRQNFYNAWVQNPEQALKIDGSFFFDTGEASHELKFGGRIRQSTSRSNFNWPGRNIVHLAGENFGASPGPIDFFFLYRGQNGIPVEVEYNSLWVQDTIATGNWTINAGVRYDLQDGSTRTGTTGQSAIPEVFPEVIITEPVDAGFDWESITPRIGVTYALGEDRDTLLRTSFSQFPSQLSTFDVAWLNPAAPGGVGAYAYFLFFDTDDDNLWNGAEPYSFIYGFGYDAKNPTSNLNTLDPALDPEITSEWILGVEHSLEPELVVGLSYTWREVDDILDRGGRPIVRPLGSSGRGRTVTSADYVPDGTVSGELSNGTMLETPVFALDPGLEDTGFRHLENDARSRKYNGIALTLNKRLANQWSLRGFVHWGETEWNVPQSYLDNTDPNPSHNGEDQDGALYVVRTGVRGNERYLQASWQANLAGMVQIVPDRPWGFVLAGNAHARQGYALPYNASTIGSDFISRNVSLMDGDLDRYRLDDLYLLDLRVEKTFAATSNVNFTFGVDLFNVLNTGTVLSRETTLSSGLADYVLDVVSPRIWKLGVRVSWQ